MNEQKQITIDPEFQSLLAPLSSDEYADLERNILERGCLDPLKTWQGILIDGHNRHEICTRHGLSFTVSALSFDDREDVVDWIIDNQLGRRNLSPLQVSYYRGEKYTRMKKRVGRPDKCGNNYHINEPTQTAETVAEQYGVTEKTIRNDATFADAVNSIAEDVGPEVKQQILTGELPATKKDVVALAKLPANTQKAVVEKIVSGEARTVADATKALNLDLRRSRIIEASKQQIQTTPHIRHGDCLAALADIAEIDLLITDPPYFTDGNFTEVVSEFLSRVKPTGQAYVFCSADPDEVAAYLAMNRHHLILQQILVWNYNNTGQRQPNIKYNSNYQIALYFRGADAPPINKPGDGTHQYACQTVNAPDGRIGDRFHSWQKPQELIERYILNSSAEDDFVCDPFAGTGTTLLAAAKYNRRSIGADVDINAVNIAIERGCVLDF